MVSVCLLMCATAGIPTAAAQDCNALILDNAGALSSGIEQVEATARQLENRGAYVRVRTTTNFGGFQDMDSYEATLEASCPTWQDASGGTKANLIVLAVSFGDKRGAGLYYGDLWKSELEREWNPLLVDKVVPLLRSGDNAGALTGALKGIGGIIDAQTATRGATGAVVVRQPTDLSGLWSVMRWLLVLIVLCIIAWAIWQWRRKLEIAREAQQRAKLAKAACVEHVTQTETPLTVAQATLAVESKNFAGADLKPLQEALEKAQSDLQKAQVHYSELDGADANPDKDGLTAGQYGQIAAAYEELREKLRSIRETINRVDQQIGALRALANSAQADIVASEETIASAGSKITAVESVGFRIPEARETLAKAVEALENAKREKSNKSYGLMREMLTSAKSLADKAMQEAEAIRKRKENIDVELTSLQAQIAKTDGQIDQAAEAFGAISKEYAPGSWSHVTGNGSQAEEALEQARDVLAKAQANASMDKQEWTQAQLELEQVRGLVERASNLATAILNLRRDLDKAKAATPGEIEAARIDIQVARDYIASHDADVDDGLENELEQADNALGEARIELAGSQPDYIRIVKAAKEANNLADRILEKARDQYQQAQRQRKKAETTLREAERSIEAADSYIRNHRSDVDSDAQTLAQDAARALIRAKTAADINEQIAYADESDQKADRALEMARADVRREQDERDRAARAAAQAIASASRAAAYHHQSSGGIGGGRSGGSIGFGGGGGRGGGSVGFGSKGGRGGGSVGW